MNLFDNTLRDGGNVVGHGFSLELTESMVRGLLKTGIVDIELGNCKGLGAYEQAGATKAPRDEEYFEVLKPYLPKGRIGMFMLAKCANAEKVKAAAAAGLNFLRVGANASDGKGSLEAVRMVKEAGLICRYSLMKAYVSTPKELAAEAKMLQDAGVDKITIMDSAGTMGMARSAGNCATELAAATLKKEGYLQDVDLYSLLDYLDQELIPAMEPYGYHVAVNPTDLMLGLAGCHSNFLPMFRKVAVEEGVSLLKLIADVSAIDRKNPPESLLREVAGKLEA